MELMMKIREETKLLHETAEKTGFLKRLVEGKASVQGYGEYLYNLHAIYEAMEAGLERHKENHIVCDFVTPELYRTNQIYEDIAVILKEEVEKLELLSSAKVCVARIQELTETKPELLVAYAYTRFLADLFGGRTFPEMLQRQYKLSQDAMNYYQYEDLGDMKGYVMRYHTKLGFMRLSEAQKKEFIIEVNNAYIYNIALSNELDVKLYH